MNRLKSILFVALSALFCLSCVQDLEVSVEFNEPAYEIAVGDTLNLAGELKVENSVETPKFSTSDNAVAKFLSDGLLVAVAPGDVDVTVTVAGKSATAQVHVSEVTAEKILLEYPDSVFAPSEDWVKVVAKVEPGKFNYDNLEWVFTASDEEIGLEYSKVSASEYQFKVAAYKAGAKVEVKVSDKNSDLSQSATMYVCEAKGPDVAAKIIRLIAPETVTESLDTYGTITADVIPDGAEAYNYANLEWEFTASHPEETGFAYEKVSDAQYNISFTTYVSGAYVDVKVTDKVSSKFVIKTIYVKEKPQSGVVSLELSPKSLTLFVEQSVKVNLGFTPQNYDTTLFVWESSDNNVVSVKNGTLTALSEGVAKIKVTDTVSGLSDECEVVVKTPVTDVTVKKVVLDAGKLNMVAGGESYQLVATCYDEAGNEIKDYAGLVWSADQAINQYGKYDVVEVSPLGIVTPLAEGFTMVTAAVASNTSVKTICEVYVKAKELKVESLTLSPAERTIDVGQMYSLEVKTEPDLSTVQNKTITFVSSNPEVATVNADGLVKAISYGQAVITATAASGVYGTAKVTVSKDSTDEITDFQINLSIDNEPSDSYKQLPQFEKLNIKYSYTNGYAPKDSRWECSDPSLVSLTVCDGYVVVEAIYDGMMTNDDRKTVTITHFADERSSKKVIDVVRAMPKSIEFVGLPENNVLYLGDTFGPDFRVKVSPEQAAQDATVWGATEVYSVANGSRPAYKTGYYELVATAKYMGELMSGISVTTYITVKAKAVEGGVLSNTDISLKEGENATLEVNFTPAHNDNYDYNVAWKSSDESVATVHNGVVTAVAEGTATISATLSNGDVLTCAVTVAKASAAEVQVGDFYYSDGTWSTELDPSKTPIGIVFSVSNPTQMGDSQLATDHPQATHGLVVALTETADIQWQATASNVGQWLEENMSYFDLHNTDRKCGYSNTLGLKAYNAACAAENKVLVADCAPDIALGSETSGWYLPSYAEWDMLFKYEQGTRPSMISNGAIAQKIEAAGGTPFSIIKNNYDTPDGSLDAPSYWASTESSTSSTWATAMHFLHGGSTNKSKQVKTYYIARYIFAF